MDQSLPALNLSSDESAEMESSRKGEQQDVSGQSRQEWVETDFLEVVAVEKVPIEGANSGPSRPDLSFEYHVELEERAGQGSQEASSIPVPDPHQSRADSQLGRVLVANGHGQNDDAEKLVGERIKCGRIDGQWQVIDPDLDRDDPRFGESQSEGIRQIIEACLAIATLGTSLLLFLGGVVFVAYATYHIIFVTGVGSLIGSGWDDPSIFGLPYGVVGIIYLAVSLIAERFLKRIHSGK